MDKTNPVSQAAFLTKLRPRLETEGLRFQKKGNVWAKQANGGESVTTTTGDGEETTNTAKQGDYIIRNQTEAREEYVVPADNFSDKYQWLGRGEAGFDEYKALGKIVALELTADRLAELELSTPFYFIASWGEAMVAKAGDFLAAPVDFSEIYRIARKEFFETYA